MAQRNVTDLVGDTSNIGGKMQIPTYSLTVNPTVGKKGSLMYNTDDNTLRESDGVSWNFAVQNVPVGGVLTGSLPNPGLANSSVTAANLAPGAVTTASLAPGSVTTTVLADSSVTAVKIAPGTITSTQLATTGVAPGTVGDGTHVAQVSVNAQGQITALTPVLITAGGGAPSGPAGGSLAGTYPNPTLSNTILAGGPIGDASHIPQITYNSEGRLTAVSSISIFLGPQWVPCSGVSPLGGPFSLISIALTAGNAYTLFLIGTGKSVSNSTTIMSYSVQYCFTSAGVQGQNAVAVQGSAFSNNPSSVGASSISGGDFIVNVFDTSVSVTWNGAYLLMIA